MSKPVGSMSGALLARQLSGRSTSTSGSPTYYHQSSFRLSPARGPRNASRSLVVLLAGPAAQQPSPQKQIELPSADFARIKKSEFISSSVDLKGCPPQTYPEFAVIGRSNVGKSSLINMLTQNSKLAKVSKEPGGFAVVQTTACAFSCQWCCCCCCCCCSVELCDVNMLILYRHDQNHQPFPHERQLVFG